MGLLVGWCVAKLCGGRGGRVGQEVEFWWGCSLIEVLIACWGLSRRCEVGGKN